MIKLIRMLPDQAAHYWPILSKGFMSSLPPGVVPSDVVVNNLLIGVMRKNYDCWIVKAERNSKEKAVAGAITQVTIEPTTGQRTLLIYSLYARTMLSKEEWKEAFDLLSQVAAKNKCVRISGYTMNESIVSIVNSLGGNCDMRVVELEVKNAV